MITTLQKAAVAFAAMFLVVVSRAQFATPAPVGTLGQRYGEFSIGQTNSGDNLVENKTVAGLKFNAPISAAVDLDCGFTVSRVKGQTVPGMLSPSADVTYRQRLAQVAAIAYLRRGVVAPFVRASAGYEWSDEERVFAISSRAGTTRIEHREHNRVWMVGVGGELLVKRVAVTPAIQYQDSYRDIFGSDVGSALSYGLAAHLWFTKIIGGFGRVGYTRPTREHSPSTWSWDVGLRVGF